MSAASRAIVLAWLRVAIVLSAVLVLSSGCSGDGRAPPAAPKLEGPADAVPPELDVVVRIDVGRVRSALGSATVEGIRKELTTGKADDKFALDALERTDILVLALRYETEAKDFVIAAEGDFRRIDPRAYPFDPPWQAAIDLGRDVRRYDRKKPKKRADPARIYMASDRLIVLVSEAALDSVETLLERGVPGNSVRPPERGILSGAVRLRGGNQRIIDADRFPFVSDALENARSISVTLDQTAKGFSVDVILEFDDEAQATQAASALEQLRSAAVHTAGRAGILARHGRVDPQGRHVLARAELPFEVVGQTLGDALR